MVRHRSTLHLGLPNLTMQLRRFLIDHQLQTPYIKHLMPGSSSFCATGALYQWYQICPEGMVWHTTGQRG